MKYKSLLIGAIPLAAMSLANANTNGTDNLGVITLEPSSSAKENPNGPENARYGKVEFKNLTPDTDYVIEADNKESRFGAFLIRNPITVKPGETAKLQFEMDYGENASASADANVHCESDGSASAGGASLIIGGAVEGHYAVKASCEAAARLTQKAYLGLVARSRPVAKVTAVYQDKNKDDCFVKTRGGSISINPISYSAAEAHQHLDLMKEEAGRIVWTGKKYKGYVTDNNFEPAALSYGPTVNVFSPTWGKATIERCAGDPQ